MACPLPFPPRFHVALAFVDSPPPDVQFTLSDDADLALRALALQALEGPCAVPKPGGGGWLGGGGGSDGGAAAQARWSAWKELGDMPSVEAMRLYVRVLDEEVPGWWAAADAAGLAAAVVAGGGGLDGGGGGGGGRGAGGGQALLTPPARPRGGDSDAADADAGADADASGWEAVSPSSTSPTPPPRYGHAACLVSPTTLLTAGGCGPGGRLLGDAWALDLESLTWTAASPRPGTPGALPPRTGLALIPWGAAGAIAVGGHAPRAAREAGTAPSALDLFSFDPSCAGGRWSALPTSGPAPEARGGHVAVRVGPRSIVVWGGEASAGGGGGGGGGGGSGSGSGSGGARGRGGGAPGAPPSGGPPVWCLDVPTLTWSAHTPSAAGRAPPPQPRTGAAGAAVRGRWVVFFGGAAPSAEGGGLTGDVAVLDTHTWAWLSPAIAGPAPPPRAGHAAAALGRSVFFVGGGDDAAGRGDAWALDCSGLPASASWAPLAPPAPPTARAAGSEGTALVALPAGKALLAFGGNAGRLHAELAVLRLSPAAAAGWGEGGEAADAAEEEGGGVRDAALAAAPAPSSSAAAAAAAAVDPSELALTRRQLASAQEREAAAQAEANAERAARAAAEAEVARLRKEVARWRAVAEAAGVVEPEEVEAVAAPPPPPAPARGLWAYVSGAT